MKRNVFLLALFALILLQGLFVYGYVSQEHTVYFWDHAMYHLMARDLAGAFHMGFAPGLAVLNQSLAQDYNYIFALPSLPAFALFGNERPVFLLTNFLVFFVAFEAAVAFVLRRVFGLGWPQALLFGFGVCALIPPLWLPLLEGYPDIGAAACVAFALGLFLTRPDGLFTAVLAGLLLGFAVLLRRHFAYAAVALLLTSAGFSLFDCFFRTPPGMRLKALLRQALFYVLCGTIMAAAIGIIAPEFLRNALTVDYGKLYLSYKNSAAGFLLFALGGFGFLLSGAALGGFILALRKWPEARRPLAFVAAATLVWFVVWCGGPVQKGHHYILHFLPLFVSVGLAGLFLGLWRSFPAPRAFWAITPLALLLASNSVWALWLSPDGVPPNSNGAPRLLSAPRPPVVRKDYGELVRLGSYLIATTTPEDRVFVLGSSFIFNQDIVRAVNTDILHHFDALPRFLQGPEVDSAQSSPLDAFATANVYVVPEPPQYHLGADAQKVVTAAAQQFPPSGARQILFHKDAESFALEDGVRVSVWRRDPWAPDALHEALADMRKTVPAPRQDWIALSALRQMFIGTNEQNQTVVYAGFDPLRAELGLFFDYPLAPGDYRISAGVLPQGDCYNPRFELSVLASNGSASFHKTFAPAVVPETVFQAFSVPKTSGGPAFLRLRLTTDARLPCAVVLRPVTVESL
ncbi:MAG: hypothetical protein PHY92_02620 [Alphaproteobacteria bacterium]|nr:hypothetical protein [Alphaproteobacteria bacterium]